MNDIERIRLEVVNNDLSYYELLDLYIKYLSLRRGNMSDIPNYNYDYNYYNHNRSINCYGYALRLDLPNYFNEAFIKENSSFIFDPGCFSHIYNISNNDKLIKAILYDLEILGIKYSSEELAYKVAVFQEEFTTDSTLDFHFWRLNDDGMWSCKDGYSGGVIRAKSPTGSMGYKLVRKINLVK